MGAGRVHTFSCYPGELLTQTFKKVETAESIAERGWETHPSSGASDSCITQPAASGIWVLSPHQSCPSTLLQQGRKKAQGTSLAVGVPGENSPASNYLFRQK